MTNVRLSDFSSRVGGMEHPRRLPALLAWDGPRIPEGGRTTRAQPRKTGTKGNQVGRG